MSKKIKINIPWFGARYCSNNVEYKLQYNGYCYRFYKKGTNIYHNEYGPAIEYKYGSYEYIINNKLHKLNDCAYYSKYSKDKEYYIIDKYLGKTKKEFVKNLASALIPIEKNKDVQEN